MAIVCTYQIYASKQISPVEATLKDNQAAGIGCDHSARFSIVSIDPYLWVFDKASNYVVLTCNMPNQTRLQHHRFDYIRLNTDHQVDVYPSNLFIEIASPRSLP